LAILMKIHLDIIFWIPFDRLAHLLNLVRVIDLPSENHYDVFLYPGSEDINACSILFERTQLFTWHDIGFFRGRVIFYIASKHQWMKNLPEKGLGNILAVSCTLAE